MEKRRITPEDLIEIKFVNDPEISPDGRRVIFAVKTIDEGKNRYLSHLFMGEVETGKVWQFTHGACSDTGPRWSPDGESIAFTRKKDGISQVWLNTSLVAYPLILSIAGFQEVMRPFVSKVKTPSAIEFII